MYHGRDGALLSASHLDRKDTTVCRRILRTSLVRLGPLCAAALLFALVGAPGALAGPNVIQNPGFETGNFAGWGWGGSFGAYADVTPYNAHSGSHSAVIGYPYRPANINSFITHMVVVPFGNPMLTFWIRPQCTSPTYDAFRVLIRDMSIGLYVSQPIFECTTSSAWVPRSVDMTRFAGKLVELRFDIWTRGLGSAATYTLLDDVSLT
jgi:hypothetical protein